MAGWPRGIRNKRRRGETPFGGKGCSRRGHARERTHIAPPRGGTEPHHSHAAERPWRTAWLVPLAVRKARITSAPRELSIDLVADQRFGRVTGRTGAL